MPARNPILPGVNPDPSICRVGRDYFITTSTFEFFPGVAIYHSVDLSNWELLGHALRRPSQLVLRGIEPGFGIWAPTIRYHRGRFYIATALAYGWGKEAPRGFYVWSDDIWDETKWSDPVYFDVLGIDQDLFFDNDGRTYLSVAKVKNVGQPYPTWEAVWGTEIDLRTGRSLKPPVLLRRSSLDSGIAEGSHIFKRHKWYYLCVAEGGTEEKHQEWIFRSESPLGPYHGPSLSASVANPILHNSASLPVRHTGHVDFVEDNDGRWWAVLLAIRPSPNGVAHLGRETYIASVAWTEDDWPIINGGKAIDFVVPELPNTVEGSAWSDEFQGDTLQRGWYHSQSPFVECYSLKDRLGWLAITGNGYAIHDGMSPALLLRKQTFVEGQWSVTVDFSPVHQDEEAGITAFRSKYGFIALLIRRTSTGGKEVVLRYTDQAIDSRKASFTKINVDLQDTVARLDSNKPIVLTLRATSTHYTGCYREQGATRDMEIGLVSVAVLQRSDKIGSTFTGTHLGLFAQRLDDTSCSTPAYFYRPAIRIACQKH